MKKVFDVLESFWWKSYHKVIDLKYTFKARWQILTRGYSDDEVWNLFYFISKYTLPRLKALRTRGMGYSSWCNNQEEWHESLDKMILAFELIVAEEHYENFELVEEGLDEFRKYYLDLWD